MDRERGSAVIDKQAQERAEGWVFDLGQKLDEAELVLATLGGFCDGDLSRSVVGAIGISVTEAKQQMPALRQAVRDIPCAA
jgi:hypothetical protein